MLESQQIKQTQCDAHFKVVQGFFLKKRKEKTDHRRRPADLQRRHQMRHAIR